MREKWRLKGMGSEGLDGLKDRRTFSQGIGGRRGGSSIVGVVHVIVIVIVVMVRDSWRLLLIYLLWKLRLQSTGVESARGPRVEFLSFRFFHIIIHGRIPYLSITTLYSPSLPSLITANLGTHRPSLPPHSPPISFQPRASHPPRS